MITKAQRAALEMAIEGGGEIQIGGIDGQNVRRDVAYRCYCNGWFKPSFTGDPYEGWKITEAGRDVLRSNA